jgi:N-acetylglucosamine-6-sulfatase
VDNPGRQVDQMILNIDLAPSLLEMAGLPVPETMEGRSFLPALLSGSSPGRRAWLYEYYADFPFRVPSCHAVRTKEHIYIEFEGRRGRELYDLQADPRQKNNLIHADEGREIARGLKAMLEVFKGGLEP